MRQRGRIPARLPIVLRSGLAPSVEGLTRPKRREEKKESAKERLRREKELREADELADRYAKYVYAAIAAVVVLIIGALVAKTSGAGLIGQDL